MCSSDLDDRVVRLAQRITVVFGVMGTGVALLLVKLQLASLWDFFMQLIGLTGGALAGLFALGIFTRRANGPGALVGAVAGVIVLYIVQRHTRVSFFLYGGTGIVATFVVGYLASLMLPAARKPLAGLTVFTTVPRTRVDAFGSEAAPMLPAAAPKGA